MLKSFLTLPALLSLSLPLSLCQGDETVARYGAADRIWELRDLNGSAYPATATLTFPAPGRIAGTGPCNSFSVAMTVPYPWFEATDFAATGRACPVLAQETRYFTALADARISEVLDSTLILTGGGIEMVFTAAD